MRNEPRTKGLNSISRCLIIRPKACSLRRLPSQTSPAPTSGVFDPNSNVSVSGLDWDPEPS